jgi:hypothetical protein
MTKSKKVGGTMDYPFQNEFHNYPIPDKTSFPITSDVNTNVVSNKDLYGCGIKEGMWVTNGGIVRGGSKKQQQKKQQGTQKQQKGGDCGCAGTTMQLGGSKQKQQKQQKQQGIQKRKQKGAGFGYSFDMAHPITNMPDVVRYPTDTAYQGVDTIQGGIVMSGGRGNKVQNEYLVRVSGGKTQQQKQKGGSPASDDLMAYFLDFQSKCRASQIY